MPSGEVGRIFPSETLTRRLEFSNDSYALLAEKDWDDLRTFGIYSGLSLRGWAAETAIDSLTDRTGAGRKTGRIDQLSFAVSRRLFAFTHERFSAGLSAGTGLRCLGDFGLREIQDAAHFAYGSDRPSPDRYDSPGTGAMLTLNALLVLGWKNPAAPVDLVSSVEAGQNGFFRSFTCLEFRFGNGFLGTTLYGGWRQAFGYRDAGRTVGATLVSENGACIGTVFRAGMLETGFSCNPETLRQAGYAAISLPAAPGQERGETKGSAFRGFAEGKPLAGRDGTVSAVELRLMPLLASLRIRRSLCGVPLEVSPVLGLESGPTQTPAVARRHYRYEQASFGVDIVWPAFGWLDLYIDGGIGIRKENLFTSTETTAVVLSSRNSGSALAEAGIRLFLPATGRGLNRYGIGFAGYLECPDIGHPSILTWMQLSLIGRTGR